MSRPRIGQVLAEMGKLSPIDIDEVLVEQGLSGRRFGEIAMCLGLVGPEHVAQAWCQHMGTPRHPVKLRPGDIERQAIAAIHPSLARELHILPIRLLGEQLIVAASRHLEAAQINQLAQAAGKDIHVVRAEARPLDALIRRFYPASAAA